MNLLHCDLRTSKVLQIKTGFLNTGLKEVHKMRGDTKPTLK